MNSRFNASTFSRMYCNNCLNLYQTHTRECSTELSSVAHFIRASQLEKINDSKRKQVVQLKPRQAQFIQSLLDAKEVASRSVLIKSIPTSRMDHVESELRAAGSVKQLDYFPSNEALNGPHSYNVLAEFEVLKDFDNFIRETDMRPANQRQSLLNMKCRRVLNFKALRKKECKSSNGSVQYLLEHSHPNKLQFPQASELHAMLKPCNSLTEAIVSLSNAVKMDKLQIRLNYLSSQIVDDVLSVQFPEAVTLPHGSTVSSLGNKSTDLDLICHPFGAHYYPSIDRPYYKDPDGWSPSDLDMCKFSRHMIEMLSFYVRFFISGRRKGVNCLSHARVPIVQYTDDIANTDCDLAVTTYISDGVKASYMLKEMIACDSRFEHLVRAVKLWAKKCQLSSDGKGNGFTNFSLVHMVIYFMQYNQLHPTTDTIYNEVAEDVFMVNDSGKVNSIHKGNADIDKLYIEFFRFWSSFDFTKTVDVSTGKCYEETLPPRERGALQILNSLRTVHNISRNTDSQHLTQFKAQATQTCNMLQRKGRLKRFGNLHI